MKKRIVCLVIAFLLLLTLVSCEKEPTLLDITQGVNRNWDSYNQILYYANLETHTAKKAEDVSVFYRCVQEVSLQGHIQFRHDQSHQLLSGNRSQERM